MLYKLAKISTIMLILIKSLQNILKGLKLSNTMFSRFLNSAKNLIDKPGYGHDSNRNLEKSFGSKVDI